MSMLSNNTTIGGKKPLLPSNEYTNNGPSKEKLGIVYENITGSVNLNNYRTEGNYTFYNITSATNFPSGTWTGNYNSHLTVQRFKDSNYCVQIITKQSSFEMYIRYSNSSSSWSSWQKIWNASNDGSSSGLDADLLDGVQGSLYLKNNQKGTDFNSCSTPGIYAMYRSNGVLNSPTNDNYYGCITCATDGNNPSGYIAQIAFTDNSSTGKVYIRYKTGNSTWNTWHVLWASNDITNLILADERLKYYGDKDIVPSDKSYFTVNETGETITGLTDTGKTQTKLVIPYKIKDVLIRCIGDTAFQDCSSLTSINIPNSVTSIGSGAFINCYSLTLITIPNSVTSIGSGAFGFCSSLTSINIPNSVTSIGGGAFQDCSSLTSINIPNSVTSIEDGTFQYCSSLKSINIPNSVTSIGSTAFYNCTNFTIYCEQGSYAETYAKENNIPVIYITIKEESLNSGSNVDADTVDGKHGTEFVYNDTTMYTSSISTLPSHTGIYYVSTSEITGTTSTFAVTKYYYNSSYYTLQATNCTDGTMYFGSRSGSTITWKKVGAGVEVLTTDPTSAVTGDIWIRSDLS